MRTLRNSEMNEHLFLFREGQQALEEFDGEKSVRRGIKQRFKHDVEGISLHDAEILAELQEGHKHTASYEAIMLLDGEIEACCWDGKGRIETKPLFKRGDLVVFPPRQNHTLFVKQDSRIIVVRFFPQPKIKKPDERIPVRLPGNLESLRVKTLDMHNQLRGIFQQIGQELRGKG